MKAFIVDRYEGPEPRFARVLDRVARVWSSEWR
jgi:hypothetical protein